MANIKMYRNKMNKLCYFCKEYCYWNASYFICKKCEVNYYISKDEMINSLSFYLLDNKIISFDIFNKSLYMIDNDDELFKTIRLFYFPIGSLSKEQIINKVKKQLIFI